MSLRGKEIYRGFDSYGAVRVLDDGNKRYLAFGEFDEQSCSLTLQPHVPQHDYIRSMLLVLLFNEPKSCLTLGLGAGALNSCLYRLLPDLQQHVVELRPEVIEVAHRFFKVPRCSRLKIYQNDAHQFIQQSELQVDILFSDIYTEQGVDEQQLSPEYLHFCAQQLNDDGWLVLNCWQEHRSSDTLDMLRELFDDVRGCTTESGNWVIFAGCYKNSQTITALKEKARSLAPALDFSLISALSRLQEYNRT